MQKSAERWHIAALQSQQAKLSQHLQNGTLVGYRPSEQEILTSMMLLYFELISPSATASWLKHLSGVAILLQLRGPEHCQTGAMNLLFRSLRLLMVYCSLRSGEPSTFASKQWQTVPFVLSGKTDIDRLIDILLLASNLLTTVGVKNSTSEKGMAYSTGPSLQVSITELLAQVTLHEKQYRHMTCYVSNEQTVSVKASEN
ncbi:hypothetical protein PT974_11099 [Cladobotryum mycophilum]|uniref:Uncharacterized protein n=1 Tax=Cladobotryum mycophilum TaxID=491253 RepID=A0ABR0SBL4_9HYPO